ncbi:hypothetical protein VIBRN418_14776 [Vibrio sp. N418]|nr:hypothetical protein VIBRN418_14776 [Vibrio sp. N418]
MLNRDKLWRKGVFIEEKNRFLMHGSIAIANSVRIAKQPKKAVLPATPIQAVIWKNAHSTKKHRVLKGLFS